MAKKTKKDKKSADGSGGKTAKRLKGIAENALLADVVAAALVATAAALKDSNRARALADDAGEELAKLSKAGAERGSAMWEMALQIGRRSLDALGADRPAKRSKAKSAGKPKPAAKKPAKKKRTAAATK